MSEAAIVPLSFASSCPSVYTMSVEESSLGDSVSYPFASDLDTPMTLDSSVTTFPSVSLDTTLVPPGVLPCFNPAIFG